MYLWSSTVTSCSPVFIQNCIVYSTIKLYHKCTYYIAAGTLYMLFICSMHAGTLLSRSSVTAKMYPTSRSIYVDWEFTAIPDHVVSCHTQTRAHSHTHTHTHTHKHYPQSFQLPHTQCAHPLISGTSLHIIYAHTHKCTHTVFKATVTFYKVCLHYILHDSYI